MHVMLSTSFFVGQEHDKHEYFQITLQTPLNIKGY